MLELANQHAVLFSVILVLPAPVAFLVAYWMVRARLENPPAELIGKMVASVGIFSAFLAVGDVTILPEKLPHLSFEALCVAVPLLMFILGASWGVFGAGAVIWRQVRRSVSAG